MARPTFFFFFPDKPSGNKRALWLVLKTLERHCHFSTTMTVKSWVTPEENTPTKVERYNLMFFCFFFHMVIFSTFNLSGSWFSWYRHWQKHLGKSGKGWETFNYQTTPPLVVARESHRNLFSDTLKLKSSFPHIPSYLSCPGHNEAAEVLLTSPVSDTLAHTQTQTGWGCADRQEIAGS